MLPWQCHTAFSERLVFWQCHPSRFNYHLVSIRRRQNMQQSCKVYKSQTLIHYTSQWVRLSIQTHHTGSVCKNQKNVLQSGLSNQYSMMSYGFLTPPTPWERLNSEIFKFINKCFAQLRYWKNCLAFTKPTCCINICFAGNTFLRLKSDLNILEL